LLLVGLDVVVGAQVGIGGGPGPAQEVPFELCQGVVQRRCDGEPG
jgi:hypothetical protein